MSHSNIDTTAGIIAKNIVFALYDAVILVDFTRATEVFNSVPDFMFHWLAPTMDSITTAEKMQLLPTGTFDDVDEEIEIQFVPGGNFKGITASMFDVRYRNFVAEASAMAA